MHLLTISVNLYSNRAPKCNSFPVTVRKGGSGNKTHCLALVFHKQQQKHLPQATGKALSIMNINLPQKKKKPFEKGKW